MFEQQAIRDRADSIPDGFVTIGFDPGSAPYFIGTIAETQGVIYFYDPSGFLDPDGSPKLYLAATSFTDLLNRMAVDV